MSIILISLASGLFKNTIFFTSIIFVHELGHFLIAKLLGWNVEKIYFYPYGGYTKFNGDLNKPKKEELLIMLMGPIFQIVFYILISKFLTINELALFKNYHYSILIFNLLPIYPLDGGKLLNIIINYFSSFRRSFRLTMFISYLGVLTIIFVFILKKTSLSLSLVLVLILVISKLTSELRKEKYYFNKFLLERYLNKYNFSKVKVIKGINDMSRDYKHVIFYNSKTISEKDLLQKHFNYKI